MKLLRLARAWAERAWAGRLAYRFSFFAGIISTAVFFVALYYVSHLVPAELLPGGDYFTMTVIGVGLYSFVGAITTAPRHFLMNEIGIGTFETLLTLAPPMRLHIVAATLNQALRAFARAALIVCVPWLLGWKINISAFPLLLPIFLLAGCAAFGFGLIHGAIDLQTRAAGRLVSVFSGATAILAGVYFPVGFLPEPLRMISSLLPAKHAIDGAREILIGGATPISSYTALAILAATLLPLGIILMRRALFVIRRDGTFLTY